MILYLSGTGNSRHIAYRLAENLSEPLYFIPESNPATLRFQGESLGIVCPVYSWGIPPLVLEFISRLTDQFVKQVSDRSVWVVLTCGDETAYAPEMLHDALKHRGLTVSGGWCVIMPNDYVLLPGFDVDSKELEQEKINKSEERIDYITCAIKSNKYEHDYVRGGMPWVKSRIIYPLFKRWGVFPKRWHWTQECVSCGRCKDICPVGNVDFINGHPRWGENCISCTACFHICPTHAIEYGNITRHKHQYRTLLKPLYRK